MDKHIEDLVHQAKEMGNMIYKTTQLMRDQLQTQAKILSELEIYNDPNTVTPENYGVKGEGGETR